MLQEILDRNCNSRPLLHGMANLVTANDCANLALACGGSSIMAEDLEEVAEITASCDGLILNLGTASPRKIESLIRDAQTGLVGSILAAVVLLSLQRAGALVWHGIVARKVAVSCAIDAA